MRLRPNPTGSVFSSTDCAYSLVSRLVSAASCPLQPLRHHNPIEPTPLSFPSPTKAEISNIETFTPDSIFLSSRSLYNFLCWLLRAYPSSDQTARHRPRKILLRFLMPMCIQPRFPCFVYSFSCFSKEPESSDGRQRERLEVDPIDPVPCAS